MTLFRAARAAVQEIRANVENPSYPLTSATLVELFAGGKTHAGVYVSENTAHRIVAVYRAWSLLAGSVGSLPLQAFTGEPPGGDRWFGDQAGLLSYPGGRDETTGLPVPGSPSAMVFYETAMVHLLSWGNAYIVRVPNSGRTRIVALDLLLPHCVAPRWCRKTADNPYGKEFVVMSEDGVSIATPADVIHVRAMGPSLLQGLSPIGAARQALGLSVAAEEYGARLFGSGSLMSGVLQTDQRLKPGDADTLKERWRTKIQGLANSHDVAVLDSGLKWQPVSMPPDDAQFIESRKFQVVEIARLYGIPPHMLGDVERSTSWGTGIAEQGITFNRFTLRPWLARVEQALSNEVLPRGVNCRFNVRELLSADTKSEIEAHQSALFSGQETPNEARLALGRPAVAGGDELLFPMNYGSLANVVNPPEPTPATDSPPVDTSGGVPNE